MKFINEDLIKLRTYFDTQQELANMLGLKQPTISQAIAGNTQLGGAAQRLVKILLEDLEAKKNN